MKKNVMRLVDAIESLKNKKDCKVDANNRIIYILGSKVFDIKKKETVDNPKKQYDLGNGSWGKIDFLIKQHGFTIQYVKEF
jgi:hypothetical protein